MTLSVQYQPAMFFALLLSLLAFGTAERCANYNSTLGTIADGFYYTFPTQQPVNITVPFSWLNPKLANRTFESPHHGTALTQVSELAECAFERGMYGDLAMLLVFIDEDGMPGLSVGVPFSEYGNTRRRLAELSDFRRSTRDQWAMHTSNEAVRRELLVV